MICELTVSNMEKREKKKTKADRPAYFRRKRRKPRHKGFEVSSFSLPNIGGKRKTYSLTVQVIRFFVCSLGWEKGGSGGPEFV